VLAQALATSSNNNNRDKNNNNNSSSSNPVLIKKMNPRIDLIYVYPPSSCIIMETSIEFKDFILKMYTSADQILFQRGVLRFNY
jgi:hypothetical protein